MCMCCSQFGERIKGQRGTVKLKPGECVCLFRRGGWDGHRLLHSPIPVLKSGCKKNSTSWNLLIFPENTEKKTEISIGKSYFLSCQSTFRIWVLLITLHPDLRPGLLSPGTCDHLLSWSPHHHPRFLQSVLNTQSGSSLKGKSDRIPTSAQNSSMAHLIQNKNEKPHKGSHGHATTPSLGHSSSLPSAATWASPSLLPAKILVHQPHCSFLTSFKFCSNVTFTNTPFPTPFKNHHSPAFPVLFKFFFIFLYSFKSVLY